jgi:hypothetical protein
MKKLHAWKWRAAAATAVGALYVLAARATPVGAAEDDALQLLLARSVRHGAFAFPDGTPANDPLPGFAALISLPATLVDPRWDVLKIIGLLSAAAAIYLTWKLARRFLDENWALLAAGLVALNPLTVTYGALILPDLPYLALSLFLFDRMAEPGFSSSALMIAAAAGATLLRPHGAWLVLCLGLGLAATKGARKAAAFALPALVPLALWTARNRWLTGSGSGYLLNMRAETAALAVPRIAVLHAAGLLAAMGGDGLLTAGRMLPLAGLTAAGAAALALAAFGAVKLVRKNDPRAFAIAAYAVCLCAQHLLWMALEPRYVLPLLPFAWILILAAAAPFLKAKSAPAFLFVLLAAPALPLDWALAAPGLNEPAHFQPATMAWLAAHAPKDALVQTLEPQTVALLSGRAAELPDFSASERDAWLAASLARRVEFVHVVSTFAAGGFITPAMRRVVANSEAWCRSTPYAQEAFRDEAEGASVFRLAHPHPENFLKAWSEFADAATAMRRGEPAARIRARLDEAVALEPRLALAWALRGLLSATPDERRRFLEKARTLDPTSEMIRAELDGPSPAGKLARPSLLRSQL